MARPKVNIVVLDPGSGKARPGALVTFYESNTLTKAPLFADDDLSSIGNPVQANGLGQVAVRVNPGLYDVSMVWDGAQPTVVEDVLAWTPETAILTSPGDIIIGGPAGGAVRLAVGSNGQAFIVEGGMPKWVTLSAGHGLPSGADGSLLGYGTGGLVTPILPGVQDQALAMMGGQPSWVSSLLPPGTTLPISQPGDLVVGQVTTGAVARLPRGATDDVLTVAETGGLVWVAGGAVARGHGDCYLGLADASTLYLTRAQGSQIWVGGSARTIPIGNVPLGVAGLTPDTTYYIYAAWVSNALVLEASTTGYTGTGGLTHKTGDESRTLVGMARVYPGPSFVYTEKQRGVHSFFHQSAVSATSFLTAHRTSTSTTLVELHPEIRAEFLSWNGIATMLSISGIVSNPLPGAPVIESYIGLDGSVVGGVAQQMLEPQWANIACTRSITLAEGYHVVTLIVRTSGAPAPITWQGDAGGIICCRTHAIVTGWD